MTKEQIKEAAICFADNELKNLDKSPFAINARADYDNGLTKGFVVGANWRIKSVWHNMEEKPNFKILPILLKHKSGTIHFIDETPAHWEYMMKYYVRWAYIEDLLPNTEE